MNGSKAREWFKKHWQEVAAFVLAAVLAIYLYYRGKSSKGGGTVPVAVPTPGSGAGSSGSSAGSPDITPLLQQLQTQEQKSQDQQQGFMQQLQQSFQGAMQQLQQSFQQEQQSQQSSLVQAEQQLQQQAQQQLQQIRSAMSTSTVLPNDNGGNASAVSAWAKGLDIPVSWAQRYLASGHTMSEGITTLNDWLDSQGLRNPNGSLNLVPEAVRAAGSQGGAYVPGNVPASAQSPAGGGVYRGLTDAQTVALFQRTYGPNWQSVWQQQHAAEVAKNGR